MPPLSLVLVNLAAGLCLAQQLQPPLEYWALAAQHVRLEERRQRCLTTMLPPTVCWESAPDVSGC